MFNGQIRYDSEEYQKILNRDGGSGSGNWGHVGRPGARGGSGKGGGAAYRIGSKELGYTGTRKAFQSGLTGEEKVTANGNKVKLTDSINKYGITKRCQRSNVEHNPIQKYSREKTEEQIIAEIGGTDKTKGSCASVAYAYACQKAGYDVVDFRGGESQDAFSTKQFGAEIAEMCGGKVVKDYNDYKAVNELTSGMQDGKEYILRTGRHAAVVRKNNGQLRYLELQKENSNNKWNELDKETLKSRFGCKRSRSIRTYYGSTKRISQHSLVGVSELGANQDFLQIAGYINTAFDKQKKGAGGSAK